MINDNKKVDDQEKNDTAPVVAAIVGAVVGASAVVAGANALKNKSNTDKTKRFVKTLEAKAVEVIEDMKEQTKKTGDKVEEKLTDGKKKVAEVSKSLKDAIETKQ